MDGAPGVHQKPRPLTRPTRSGRLALTPPQEGGVKHNDPCLFGAYEFKSLDVRALGFNAEGFRVLGFSCDQIDR